MSHTCRSTLLGSASTIVLSLFVALAGVLPAVTAQPADAAVTSSDGAVAPLIETLAGAVCSPSVATGIGIEPAAVAPDGAGGFYVTDAIHSVVCRVAADGTVRVAAGNGSAGYSGDGGPATATRLYTPSGLAVDSGGNLFIADRWNQRVRRVDARTGTITTVAGTGVPGGAGDGGRAVDAQLNYPIGVAVDTAGNLFIADSRNNRVRRVSSGGTITTLAGTGVAGSTGDGGAAASARLSFPTGLALNGTSLYVADASNNRVRRIDLKTSKIYAFAGTGAAGGTGDGGSATAATLSVPLGVAASGSTVYITDAGNNRVRVVRRGRISAFAGTGTAGFSGDGAAATSARLSYPSGVAADGTDVLIVDQGNYRVRSVSGRTGAIRTAAGNGTQGFSGEGRDARRAQLSQPTALTWSGDRLLIADGHNNVVRRLEANGRLVTIAGTPGVPGATGDGGPAVAGTLGFITGIATDARGNLFIADWGHRIRKVDAAGVITTLAGTGTAGFGGDGGPARAAVLNKPSGLVVDAWGTLYVADSGNNRVRRFSTVGGEVTGESRVSTVAGTGVAGFAGDGGSARNAAFNGPAGLAIDARGSLYVADEFNQRVRRIGIDGVVTTVAGTGVVGYSPEGTTATSSALNHPRAIAFDGHALVVADTGNCIVRRIASPGKAGTKISTVAGWTPIGGVRPVCDYAGERVHPTRGGAMLFNPSSLAVDAAGALYIADSLNHRVRRVS